MRTQLSTSVVAFALLLGSCHPAAPHAAPGAARKATPAPVLSPAARLGRAKQRLALSHYGEAEADFRALLVTPQAAEARLGLGRVLVTTGRYEEAKNVLAPLAG